MTSQSAETVRAPLHEVPHFEPDTGACWCECKDCTNAQEDCCLCPECPGNCGCGTHSPARLVLPPNGQHEWQAKAIAAGWTPPWHRCTCTAPTDLDRDCPQHGEVDARLPDGRGR